MAKTCRGAGTGQRRSASTSGAVPVGDAAGELDEGSPVLVDAIGSGPKRPPDASWTSTIEASRRERGARRGWQASCGAPSCEVAAEICEQGRRLPPPSAPCRRGRNLVAAVRTSCRAPRTSGRRADRDHRARRHGLRSTRTRRARSRPMQLDIGAEQHEPPAVAVHLVERVGRPHCPARTVCQRGGRSGG